MASYCTYIPTPDQCLQYIDEINRLHTQIVEANQTSLERAMEAGALLIQLKKTVVHGRWSAYLAEHFPKISERTAQDYMWAANQAPKIEAEKKKAENGENPNPQRAALLTSIRGAKQAFASPRAGNGGGGQPPASAPIEEPEDDEETFEDAFDSHLNELAPDELEAKLEPERLDALTERRVKAQNDEQRKEFIVSLVRELPSLEDAVDVMCRAFPERWALWRKALDGPTPPSLPNSDPSVPPIVRPAQPANVAG
jgi:hypothetical protein